MVPHLSSLPRTPQNSFFTLFKHQFWYFLLTLYCIYTYHCEWCFSIDFHTTVQYHAISQQNLQILHIYEESLGNRCLDWEEGSWRSRNVIESSYQDRLSHQNCWLWHPLVLWPRMLEREVRDAYWMEDQTTMKLACADEINSAVQ